MTGSARGIQRERAVLELLREDWVVFRAPGSLGCADVIAMRQAKTWRNLSEVRLIEVKSTSGGPYERFGPAKREALRQAAERAGAEPYLAWWPIRGQLRWIHADEWP